MNIKTQLSFTTKKGPKSGLPGKRLNVKKFNEKCKNLQEKEKFLAYLLKNIHVEYRNEIGYEYNVDGSCVGKTDAKYYLYKMDSLQTKQNEQLYGWYYTKNKIRGFVWGSIEDFKMTVVKDHRSLL